jgi:ribosomal protein S26
MSAAGCDLVWFDGTETARLNGPGLLELIGLMAASYDLPHQPLSAATRCPRCAGPLKTVHNQSRWGRSVQLQCLKRDGAYQSFAEFLEEKGLLRPMSRLDRAKLLRDRGRIDCVNCGAAIGKDDERCPYCSSVPSLLDVARLARALDPEAMLASHELPRSAAKQQAMQCAPVAPALPPGETMSCAQCGATLAIPSLREAYAAVESWRRC